MSSKAAQHPKSVGQFPTEPDPALPHLPSRFSLEVIQDAAAGTSTADELLHDAVAAARADGHTWRTIGQVLGVSSQAAHKRFGPSSSSPEGGRSTDTNHGE
jgi:hypothetical protein